MPFDLILDAALEYRKAAAAAPDCQFFIMKGNHDWTRDLTRRSAFDVFAALVAHVPNIEIITEMCSYFSMVFYPWQPLDDAKEKLQGVKGKVLFGHFDTEFGEHNMVPTELHFERIYTGHVHKADRFTRHGTEVIVVGSMQPYAHGEEADDSLYVTLTPDQIVGDLRNKCVRVLGQFDGEIDCLQLTFKQEKKADDGSIEHVTLGDFNMDTLFAESFAEAGVSAERTEAVLGQYQSKRTAAGV